MPTRSPGPRRHAAFTLIELIFVLALLAIGATFVATHMSGFFSGRALNYEARRMLSLTHYAQSRAVAEGVPVVLWINSRDNTYGVSVLSSFNDQDGDPKACRYAVESSLTLETTSPDSTVVSEDDDEMLGLPDGLAAIRFNPDGFVDPSSVASITIRQGNEAALALTPTDYGLGYEIRPAANLN